MAEQAVTIPRGLPRFVNQAKTLCESGRELDSCFSADIDALGYFWSLRKSQSSAQLRACISRRRRGVAGWSGSMASSGLSHESLQGITAGPACEFGIRHAGKQISLEWTTHQRTRNVARPRPLAFSCEPLTLRWFKAPKFFLGIREKSLIFGRRNGEIIPPGCV